MIWAALLLNTGRPEGWISFLWLTSLLLMVLTLVRASRVKAAIRAGLQSSGLAAARASQIIVVLAYLITSISVSLPGFLEAQIRAKVSRIRADMRALSSAIEKYREANGSYPAWAIGSEGVNAGGAETVPELARLPSFRAIAAGASLATLTTPTPYIRELPNDPYAPTRHFVFPYVAKKEAGREGWMLLSAGPDRDYDVDPIRMLDVTTTQPTPALLHFMYDPTNGTWSDGDIMRFSESPRSP
jgi:type II secretory pathway pseudopilin PulG